MRLIHTKDFSLRDFVGDDVPPYAILSHTWGDEEVTLQQMESESSEVREKLGYFKIQRCCQEASQQGYEYAWIDTCCIDKTSSAELSEAINSMFRWYSDASICYAYLSDVPTSTGIMKFSRGWTLQELIAPSRLTFYAADWSKIGTKQDLIGPLVGVTGVHERILLGKEPPRTCSVAERMSWAASRHTTRPEDRAYCLLGIFNVNMPLLYGEGDRAFTRLQVEILGVEEDYTILAWGHCGRITSSPTSLLVKASGRDFEPVSPLAAEPSTFVTSHEELIYHKLKLDVKEDLPGSVDVMPPEMTSRGLRLSLKFGLTVDGKSLAYLNCAIDHLNLFMVISETFPGSGVYTRLGPRLYLIDSLSVTKGTTKTIYLREVHKQNTQVRGSLGSIEAFPTSGVWINLSLFTSIPKPQDDPGPFALKVFLPGKEYPLQNLDSMDLTNRGREPMLWIKLGEEDLCSIAFFHPGRGIMFTLWWKLGKVCWSFARPFLEKEPPRPKEMSQEAYNVRVAQISGIKKFQWKRITKHLTQPPPAVLNKGGVSGDRTQANEVSDELRYGNGICQCVSGRYTFRGSVDASEAEINLSIDAFQNLQGTFERTN